MVHRWYRMACSQSDKLVASGVKKGSCNDDDSANALGFNGLERFVDRCIIAHSKILDLQPEGVRCLAQVAQLCFVSRKIRVEKSAKHRNVWQQLTQQLEAFGLQRGG